MILPLVPYTDPVLHQPAVRADIGPDLSMLLHSMIETLRAQPDGIGLAAPQVGVSVRAFVMGTEEQGFIAVVNPRIVARSGHKVKSIEACLSVPGKTVTKKRSYSITVSATNAEGDPCTFVCKDRAACVVQHEMDHLDGILIA